MKGMDGEKKLENSVLSARLDAEVDDNLHIKKEENLLVDLCDIKKYTVVANPFKRK